MRIASVALLSLVSAQFLARETHAAWPYLDSFTTWVSLLATWMVARMTLENWLYWMWADSVTAYMFGSQGFPLSAGLFLSYLVISVFGFRAWLKRYRHQSS